MNPLDFIEEKMSMKRLGAVGSPRTETTVEANLYEVCLILPCVLYMSCGSA